MSTATEQSNIKKFTQVEITKWIITLLVPFIVWLIPMSFEPSIKVFLIITAWAITCWVTVVIPVELTGVLIPCLYLFFEVAKPAVIFSPWSNTVVWGTVALLLIGFAAMNTGLSTRMAYSLLTKMNTNIRGLVWGFYYAPRCQDMLSGFLS